MVACVRGGGGSGAEEEVPACREVAESAVEVADEVKNLNLVFEPYWCLQSCDKIRETNESNNFWTKILGQGRNKGENREQTVGEDCLGESSVSRNLGKDTYGGLDDRWQ